MKKRGRYLFVQTIIIHCTFFIKKHKLGIIFAILFPIAPYIYDYYSSKKAEDFVEEKLEDALGKYYHYTDSSSKLLIETYIPKYDSIKSIYRRDSSAYESGVQRLVEIGKKLVESDRTNELKELCHAILIMDEDNIFAYDCLAYIYIEKDKDFFTAKTYIDKLYQLNRNDAITLYNMGIYFEKTGRIDSANYFYKEALNIQPDHFSALHNLSENLKRQELDTVISYHEKAIKYNPDFYLSIGFLGFYYYAQNEFEKADKYLSKWFENAQIIDSLGIIDSIKFDVKSNNIYVLAKEGYTVNSYEFREFRPFDGVISIQLNMR